MNIPLWNRTKCTLVATADSNKIFLFPFSSGLILLCNDIKLLWFILQLYVTNLSSCLSLRTLGIFYRVLKTESNMNLNYFSVIWRNFLLFKKNFSLSLFVSFHSFTTINENSRISFVFIRWMWWVWGVGKITNDIFSLV